VTTMCLPIVLAACGTEEPEASFFGSAEAEALDAALIEAGSTFQIDGAWEIERVSLGPDGIALRMGPDLDGSGTWLLLGVRALPAEQSQEDRFWQDVDQDLVAEGMDLSSEPMAISVSGVGGYRGAISGIEASTTGEPLESMFAVLFDQDCDYFIQAQWEPNDETAMRSKFEDVLDRVRFPEECTPASP
jgi:hypothetical protein